MNRGFLLIAANEALRYVRGLSLRVVVLALVLGLTGGLLFPILKDRGLHPDAGIYVVEAEANSLLLPVAQSDGKFLVHIGYANLFFQGEADLLLVSNRTAYNADSPRSLAALHDFQLAAQRYLDRIMEDEADQDAAFPVRVNIIYEARTLGAFNAPLSTPSPTPTPTTSAPPNATLTSPTSPASSPTDSPRLVEEEGRKELDRSPSEVEPPFPIESLLLTFAYLVPLNFIGQFYAGTFFGERIRHRGVLLLSGPFTGGEILLGKSLPYIAFTLLLSLAISLAIGTTLLGFLAVLPIIAFALAATLLLAILARSQRELTILIVTITVVLSTFLFLPAIFTQIHPVAYLSPVTVIAATIRGDAVAWSEFAYATVPLTFIAIVLAALSVTLYKEEELFSPKAVFSKLANAVHALAPRPRSLFGAGILAVPFAIGLELFVLIFAVTLNLQTAFVLFLLGGAAVEELLKALPIYAYFSRTHSPPKSTLHIGSAVGLGFAVGEKFALVFTLVGLDLLPLGRDALFTFGVTASLPFLLAPFLLHTATATLTAAAARRGRRALGLGVPLAILVHAAYNLALIYFLTGGTLDAT